MKGIGVVVLTGLLIASTLARDFEAGAPQFDNSTSSSQQKRTLSFAERVAYQYALEEVYWRHRIWPKENLGSKPALDAVMSAAQIEKKVEDYLRNSQLLAVHWQRPITREQLQAEMERMASQTKQPEVLQELFSALGNDPFTIAECLARPVLSERLVKQLYAHDERIHGELKSRAESELRACQSATEMKQTSGTYNETEWIKSDDQSSNAEVENGVVGCAHPLPELDSAGVAPALQRAGARNIIRMTAKEWDESIERIAAQFDGIVGRARPPSAPTARENDTAKDLERIRVGVLSRLQEDNTHFFATAALKKDKDRLKVATVVWAKQPFESWAAKREAEHPGTADEFAADYTLPAMASSSIASEPIGCANDTWIPIEVVGRPTARWNHTAAWTGNEMIVWGGYSGVADLNTGSRYNPSTDSWIATSSANAPGPRELHTAVWTGHEMIVWGGFGASSFNSGGRYSPSDDTWLATSTTNAPAARASHSAVWTGSEMIVWAGGNSIGLFNTGGRYNPSTGSWLATSTTNAPAARYSHIAVWTGSEMTVWGGVINTGPLNTGGRYDPSTNSWVATNTINAPSARAGHTGVWTGGEVVVWGGFPDTTSGGRYNPSTDAWVATNVINAPVARYYHTSVWTGSEMIVWGGYPYTNTGGRYNTSTDSWITTSSANAPAPRDLHTAVWTGSEMIVWGGSAEGNNALETGGGYCVQSAAPAVQSAVSRKAHGLSGAFDVDLSLTGTPGIECRAGGATNDYSIVVTFATAVTVNGTPQAQITSGTATVGSGGVSNGGMVTISGNSVTVPLTNVANAQTINVRLNGVTGSSSSGSVTVPISILIGDTNANGAVNSGDVAQTKARLGQTLDVTNFRSDVNANGAINAGDVSQIKSLLGTGLP